MYSKIFLIFPLITKPVITVGQFFGIMPVCGVLNTDPKRIRFEWLSLRFLLCAFTMCGTALEFLTSILDVMKTGFGIRNAGRTIFYTICGIGQIFLFNMAREWSKTIRYWYKAEYIFFRNPYNLKGKKLSTTIRLVGFVVVIIGLGDIIN